MPKRIELLGGITCHLFRIQSEWSPSCAWLRLVRALNRAREEFHGFENALLYHLVPRVYQARSGRRFRRPMKWHGSGLDVQVSTVLFWKYERYTGSSHPSSLSEALPLLRMSIIAPLRSAPGLRDSRHCM